MKIGVVTIPDYDNYGNRLQNYAVCHLLRRQFGCRAVALNSWREKAFEDGNRLLWLKYKAAGLLCAVPQLAEKRYGNKITRRHNFRSWSRRYIPTRNYYDCQQLPESLNGEFDLFFAGSDQIWNYKFSQDRFPDYFLTFAEEKKRAAISASFGVDAIPEQYRQTYQEGLSSFSHISVREEAGAKIVRELLGRETPVLIDPTMLVSPEQWLRVSRKPRVDTSRPYVLKYYLGDEAEAEKIDTWARENGCEVYELLNEQIPELYSAGPGEFISLVAGASLVASDSFHCIVFSILFRKPFLVYARQGSGNYMTSRLDTLLRKFGFEDRWKHLLAPERYLDCDFSGVDEILAEEQEKARTYIRKVLDSNR